MLDDMKLLPKELGLADSWLLDTHKTLNAPYDNGILLCKHKEILVNAMHMTGSYIIYNENRDGMLYVPSTFALPRPKHMISLPSAVSRNVYQIRIFPTLLINLAFC